MTYDELTDEEKRLLADGSARQRELSGQQAKCNVLLEDFMVYWYNTMSPILQKLQPGEIIPNPTTLAGSEDLDRDEHTNLASYFNVITDDTTGINTPAHRYLYQKAAGFENVTPP